jgi:hypothetical protein
MNFKSISEIFKRTMVSNVKTPLGRWNINKYEGSIQGYKYI